MSKASARSPCNNVPELCGICEVVVWRYSLPAHLHRCHKAALPATVASAQVPSSVQSAVAAAELRAAAARARPHKRTTPGHGGSRVSKQAKTGAAAGAGPSVAHASPDAAGSDVDAATSSAGAAGAPTLADGDSDAASDADCPSDAPSASRPVCAGVQGILRGYTIGCKAYIFDKEQLKQGLSSSSEETGVLKAAREAIVRKLRATGAALRDLVEQFRPSAASASSSAAVKDQVEDPILEVDLEAAILANIQHDRAADDLERLTFADLRNALLATSGHRGKRAASAGLSLVVLAAAGRRPGR